MFCKSLKAAIHRLMDVEVAFIIIYGNDKRGHFQKTIHSVFSFSVMKYLYYMRNLILFFISLDEQGKIFATVPVKLALYYGCRSDYFYHMLKTIRTKHGPFCCNHLQLGSDHRYSCRLDIAATNFVQMALRYYRNYAECCPNVAFFYR